MQSGRRTSPDYETHRSERCKGGKKQKESYQNLGGEGYLMRFEGKVMANSKKGLISATKRMSSPGGDPQLPLRY